MKELMLDKRSAALALLREIAALNRLPAYGMWEINVSRSLMARIDLVLDFPDEPGEEPCKEG